MKAYIDITDSAKRDAISIMECLSSYFIHQKNRDKVQTHAGFLG